MKKLALILPLFLLGCAAHNPATCEDAVQDVKNLDSQHPTVYEDSQGDLHIGSSAEDAGSAGAALAWMLLNGCRS